MSFDVERDLFSDKIWWTAPEIWDEKWAEKERRWTGLSEVTLVDPVVDWNGEKDVENPMNCMC